MQVVSEWGLVTYLAFAFCLFFVVEQKKPFLCLRENIYLVMYLAPHGANSLWGGWWGG